MSVPCDQICRLCLNKASLVESHIIPRFVFRWLVETGTGALRSAGNPNLRTKDTTNLKLDFLCDPCDRERIGSRETWFAKKVFYPLVNGELRAGQTDATLRSFVLSVLWRVLAFSLEKGWVADPIVTRAREVAEVWRRHLLEGAALGEFARVHLFITDIASSSTIELPQNFNRYFTRAVDAFVEPIENDAVVVAKFARFIAVGELTPPMHEDLSGALIDESGELPLGRELNMGRVGFLLVNRAEAADHWYQRGLSPTQAAKLTARFRADPELVARGDYGRASTADFVRTMGRRITVGLEPGRNERCPCGSGKKYKRCHGQN